MMIAAGLVMLTACTAQPTAPAPGSETLAPVAGTAPAAAAPAARANDAKYAAFARSARAQGYRPVRVDGKERWCREEGSIDSRVARQSCFAAPAVADAPAAADDTADPPRKGE